VKEQECPSVAVHTVENFISVLQRRDLAERLRARREQQQMRRGCVVRRKAMEAELKGAGRTLRARNSGVLWAPVRRSTGTISKSRPLSLSTVATRTTLGDSGIPYSFRGAMAPLSLSLGKAGRAGQVKSILGKGVARVHTAMNGLMDGWTDGGRKKARALLL